MMKHKHKLTAFSAAAIAFALGAAPSAGWAEKNKEELTLASIKFFLEYNEADADIGVQCKLGGEPYKKLSAIDPDGRKILDLSPKRSLRKQGMSDFFFESAEPKLDEVSLGEFFDRFPEGLYEFETKTLNGLDQDGETLFTHVIPAGPLITSPAEQEEVDPSSALTINWDPVIQTAAVNPPQQTCGLDDTTPCTIVAYQVIVTKDEDDERLRVFSVDMPPDADSVIIAPGFLEAGIEYELEILAVEESDNQTISIIHFVTAE